jgi:uncharacterized protein YjiS (DUF1127 family)
MVLIHNTFEKDLIIMTASTSGANISPAVLLPRRALRAVGLAWLIRLFHRPDALEALRPMADAQLRDIGIERHRIGPAMEPDPARWRLW